LKLELHQECLRVFESLYILKVNRNLNYIGGEMTTIANFLSEKNPKYSSFEEAYNIFA